MKAIKLTITKLTIAAIVATMALILAPRVISSNDGDGGSNVSETKNANPGSIRKQGAAADPAKIRAGSTANPVAVPIVRAPGAPEPSTALLYGLGLLYGGGYFRMRRKKQPQGKL